MEDWLGLGSNRPNPIPPHPASPGRTTPKPEPSQSIVLLLLRPQVAEMANTPAVRLVALVNYAARGIVAEAMQGSLASQLSRVAKKPLALLQPADE